MTAVLLIIHLLVAAALVAVILMQRSEGGALGIGGGPGGMMSGRGAANLLTRVTMVLGALFIGNSILLAVVTGVDARNRSVVDRAGAPADSELPFSFDDIPVTDPAEGAADGAETAAPDAAPEPAAPEPQSTEAEAAEPQAEDAPTLPNR